MGRSVKYPGIARTYATTGVVMPSGNTATRPSSAVNGTMRYNTDLGRFEMYQNGTWINPTSRGNLTINKDTYTGDGSTNTFGPLSSIPASDASVHVFIGNVHQNPTVAYTISSSNIVFSAAPNLGQTIEVYHGFDSTDR